MRALLLILMMLLPWQAMAQDSAEQEKSWLTDYVQNKLSTPGRQISISGIDGVLSSNATIGTITIADREGVWLTLEEVAIRWTRSALLRGRLQIEELVARRVALARQPLPDESLPSPESSRFALPELPLAIAIARLELAEVMLGEPVLGREARLQGAGNLTLEDGSLDMRLSVLRTDGPGGSLALTASFSNESRDLAIDLDLKEPANGLAATLLSIDGGPSLDLTIKGAAPLSNWKGEIALLAGGKPALAGSVALKEGGTGLAVTAAVGGPLSILAPERLRPFFGAESRLDLSGVAPAEGGFRLDTFQLAGGALKLNASGLILPDGFLRALTLDGTLNTAGSGQVPLPGTDTTLSSASLAIDYGSTTDGQWTGRLVAEGVDGPDLKVARLLADMGGQVSALDDPAERSVTASMRMVASGFSASDAGTARALGLQPSADLNVTVRAGQPLEISLLELKGAALLARATGLFDQGLFDGDIALVTESLAPFSGLAGRELSGSARLTAKGKLDILSGGFDMVLDGTAENVTTGDAGLDGLFAGTTRIAGRLARDENGIGADAFSLGNDQVRITADGRFSSTDADFVVDGSLSDLGFVDERLSGPLALDASLNGTGGVIAAKARITVDEGRLAERRLSGAALALEGTITNRDFSGTVTGDAMLDGERVALSSAFTHAERATAFSDLSFATRGAKLKGDVSRNSSGQLDGNLLLKASDISTAAALALVKAKGAMDATLELDPKDGQTLTLDGSITGLQTDGFSAMRATIKAKVTKLFAVPVVNGSMTGEKIVAGGIDIATLAANAKATDGETVFTTSARLANGSAVETSGTLTPADGGYGIALETLSVRNKGQALALEKPARLAVKSSQITLEPLSLKAGEGRIGAQGTAGDRLDLQLTLDRVPLALANMVQGDLGLGGTLGGVVSITGTSDAPSAEFAFRGQGITAAMLSKAGIEPLAVAADGQMQGQRLAVTGTLTNGQGLAASVAGTAPLGTGSLDLDVALKAFPLAIFNAVQPGAGLGGTIAGRVKVTGPAAKPDLAFTLNGSRVSTAALSDAGLPPLALSATGKLAGETVQLDRFTSAGDGLAFDARGTVPLSGTGLAVDFKGTLPLSLADGLLADRAAQARGTLSVSGRATGSLERPDLNAMLSTTGAEFIDPQSNIRLQRIALFASINGDRLTLRSFTGGLATGGTVSASGSLSLAESMPADLAIQLESARYSDGQNVSATLSGNLTLTGALLSDPLLAGRILVNRADLTVPEGGAEAEDIAVVKHRKAPESVLQTLERALPRKSGNTTATSGPVLRLNVRVEAPNKIFLRGRGLDTELGGSVTLTGPVSDIQPTGGFEIIRGRLSILAQRITLDSGRVTLIGDLDPYVDLSATTPGKDIAVTIRVTGRVSDLNISFSSQPELPEDEVLSRLIFGRSITDLSPIQLARLAAAASELAGGGPSILDQLREATGLDDLDVVTDDKGNTAARAGRYVTDQVYLGVEAGTKGNSKVTIDLDITDNLKARGSVGSEETGVGLFFEKDY